MIGIIGFNSLKYMQFLNIYKDILDDIGVGYEVVFWNREGDEQPRHDNYFGFNETVDTFTPFIKKVPAFIRYVLFVKRQIKSKKYDKLIILTTQTAVPLGRLLFKKYKKKYIFDYRDVTYERFAFYHRLVKRLARNSAFTAVSSPKFLDTLKTDKAKFVVSHNCSKLRAEYVEKASADKIRIVYWGMIRQTEFVKRLCDAFANDERIELTFHGKGYGNAELAEYTAKNRYANIYFTGIYKRDQIKSFAENTDILLNTYENDPVQQPAMTVKLYDAMRYGLPMLVTKDSYMARFSEKYGLGLSFDLDDERSVDRVVEWYGGLKQDELRKNCSAAIEVINKDNRAFVDDVIKFADGENSEQSVF